MLCVDGFLTRKQGGSMTGYKPDWPKETQASCHYNFLNC